MKMHIEDYCRACHTNNTLDVEAVPGPVPCAFCGKSLGVISSHYPSNETAPVDVVAA
jgi:hypothetical protein